MAENKTSPNQISRHASRVVITDEMMLKAVTMANEKDKVESKVKLSLSQLSINKGDNNNPVSRPSTSLMTASRETNAAGATGSGDLNGNKTYEENCPFDIVCDFLQVVMQKKYKEALDVCKTILLYEPDNEIANEFRDVLDEMVKEDGDSEDEDKPGVGADNSEESSESESSSSADSRSCSDNREEGYSSDEISESSYSSVSDGTPNGTNGGNDALSKFFETDISSSGDEENEGTVTSSGSSGSSWSSSSSSSDSSTESEDASVIADLLMAGAYSNDNHHDDTFDMISSLDYELDDNSYCGSAVVNGACIEDLGEVWDASEGKDNGK